MKYVALTGGLGNQMFIYAFCIGLRHRGEKTVLFVPRDNNSKGYGDQGYELDKLFDIQEFEDWKSRIQTTCLKQYSNFIRLFPAKFKASLFRYVGMEMVKVPENFIFYPSIFEFTHKHQLFMGTWQSEQFFDGAASLVRESFQFKQTLLSSLTVELSASMQLENSVSIHIRRGDYLSDQYSSGFAGVCTDEYYRAAMDYIQSKIESPRYYVFTDDKEWVKESFRLDNAVYVLHNTGIDSWQDMYLMSQCKHNIIANSSFSWWGAWLNTNSNKMVIAPKKWWRLFEKDDVVPDNWVRI